MRNSDLTHDISRLREKAQILIARRRLKTKVRVRLYRKILSYLNQGQAIDGILVSLSEKYEARNPGDVRAIAMRDWLSRLYTGGAFSSATQSWVSPFETMMIDAGESSGDIKSGIERAITAMTSISEMKASLYKSLGYPGAIFLVLTVMMVIVGVDIMPQMAEIADPATWPESSRLLYDITQGILQFWWVALGALTGAAVFISKSMTLVKGDLRQTLDRFPPWNIYQLFQGSMFLIALSGLMQSGVSIKNALSRLRGLSTPYAQYHLDIMISRLRRGFNPGEALNTGMLSPEVAVDIEMIGDTADFKKSIEMVAEEAIHDGKETIEMVAKGISFAMLGLAAVLIGWVYTSFYAVQAALTQSTGVF